MLGIGRVFTVLRSIRSIWWHHGYPGHAISHYEQINLVPHIRMGKNHGLFLLIFMRKVNDCQFDIGDQSLTDPDPG